jgi:hypothetical protein
MEGAAPDFKVSRKRKRSDGAALRLSVKKNQKKREEPNQRTTLDNSEVV